MTSRAGEPIIDVLCSPDGGLIDVRHFAGEHDDGVALASNGRHASTLVDLVDPGSAGKLRDFLGQLASRDCAYDWELNVPLDGEPVCFHFAGRRTGAAGERLWIVAARSRRGLLDLLEHGCEREDPAGDESGSSSDGARPSRGTADDEFAYEELTRVNNEMANLHRRAAKQASELVRLNRRKNQLLGMAAHDMRHPAAAIYAYSELLEAELSPSLDRERLEFLTTIKSTSKFLLELVNDLLDLAVIEAGELRLALEPAGLVSLVRANVGLNRILARKRGIEIRFHADVDGAEDEVKVDKRKLQQVVDNLLANAIKFSPPESLIEARVRREDERLVVTVSDEGPGIEPGEKDKLFLPFRRGRADAAGTEPGSGLGLAICRRIVEGHGGRIWVESDVGRGAVFSFSIPHHPA